MDIPISNQKLLTCSTHNDLQDPKGNQDSLCIKNSTEFVSPDGIKKEPKELFIQEIIEINKDKQQLQNALEGLVNYKNNINQYLEKIIRGIQDRILSLDNFVKNQQELITFGNNDSIDKLKLSCQIQKQNNIEIKNLAKSQLELYQLIYCKTDNLVNLLNDTIQEVQHNQSKDSRKFQYELIKESSKQENYCRAIAFNKDGSILILGCEKEIIIYQFSNGQIQLEMETQRLTNHTEVVTCLHFMKQSNSFVSGSVDCSIIIWELDNTGKWIAKSQLKEHNDYVLCILMNKNEDILVSSSFDKTVKFWKSINNQWVCQQTMALSDCSYSLSLNESENLLISCGSEPLIQVILKGYNSWTIVQTIQVDERGLRLSFLNGDRFIFQPKTKDFLVLYDFDRNQSKFYKHNEIQTQSCQNCTYFYPIQFIKDLKIITVKHGQFLNIFKGNDNNDLMLIQTIEFGHTCLFGCCSVDGKYIATWDEKSREIQIRQLRYLE